MDDLAPFRFRQLELPGLQVDHRSQRSFWISEAGSRSDQRPDRGDRRRCLGAFLLNLTQAEPRR